MLHYKGYKGEYTWDWESKAFFGKVKNTYPIITFAGKTLKEMEESFKEAIDKFLMNRI